MRVFRLMFLVLSLFSIAACAKPQNTKKATINGKEANEYFAQFVTASPEAQCAGGASSAKVKTLRSDWVSFEFELFEGGEMHVASITGFAPVPAKQKWRVDGTHLLLGDLKYLGEPANLSGLEYNDVETVEIACPKHDGVRCQGPIFEVRMREISCDSIGSVSSKSI